MRKSKEQSFIEDLYPGDSEAWPHYVKTTVAFNEAVSKLGQTPAGFWVKLRKLA